MYTLNENLKNYFENKKIITQVKATKNMPKIKNELLHTLVDFKSFSKTKFTEKMLSYQLALLGIEKESLGTFKNNYSDASAMHLRKENAIVLGNETYNNFFRFVEIIDSVAHESFHACQEKLKGHDKYDIHDGGRTLNSHSRRISKILGLHGFDEVFYFTNLMERQAFLYAFDFTEQFLTEAQSLAKNENKYLSFTLIKTALSHYIKRNVNPIRRKIDKADDKFIENIPNIYNKASMQLDRFLNLIKADRDGERHSLKDFISEIKLLKDVRMIHKDNNYLRPYIAISEILSYVPIREKVEDYLNVILSSEGATEILMYTLLLEKVPLSKSDFTKVFVCSDYFKENGSNYMEDYSLAQLDEETICKNFLISQGPRVMKEKFFELFDNDRNLLSKLNVEKINAMIAEYPETAIFLKGQQFEGTSQILHYTLDELIDKGIIKEEDFAVTKVEIADNLVNIIRHFDYPTPDNLEYLVALNRFIENPFEKQFEVEEEFNELSSVHDYHLSEKLAEHIASQRENEQQCVSLEN